MIHSHGVVEATAPVGTRTLASVTQELTSPTRSERRNASSLTKITRGTLDSFTRDQLILEGSESSLDRAIASGTIVRILPGIYCAAENAYSFYTRAHAALEWAGPDAALSGPSALFMWGLIDEVPANVEILVPWEQRPRAPAWLKIYRTTRSFEVRNRGSLRVLPPAHAVVRAYGRAPTSWRGDLVYRAVRERRATVMELRRALAQVPRVVKRKALERDIENARIGIHCPLEARAARNVFTGELFSRFVRQHEVVVEGELFRLDMFDPVTRTAVEVDSDRYHSDLDARIRDIRRDAVLATVGIQTLRMSSSALANEPVWCRRVVLETLEARTTLMVRSPQSGRVA